MKLMKSLECQPCGVGCLAWSPDSKLLLTCGRESNEVSFSAALDCIFCITLRRVNTPHFLLNTSIQLIRNADAVVLVRINLTI